MIVAKLSISAGSTTRPHSSLTSLQQWGEHEISVVDPDLLVGGTDPDPNQDPSIIKQK